MRTKALLLAAAFAAAGVATSMAQGAGAVYSVNAVGYVNTTCVPGFQLISNPLEAADNTIGKLFSNFQGGVRDGTTVYKFVGGNFKTASYDAFGGPNETGAYGGDAVNETTMPGEGVFLYLPAPKAPETVANKVLTFVGQVPQGPTTTPLPKGFSIKSSVVPQAIAIDNVKNTDGTSAAIPAADGDTFFRYIPATKQYEVISYDKFGGPNETGGWSGTLPTLNVGEAFFYYRPNGAATSWTRQFSVNNPS